MAYSVGNSVGVNVAAAAAELAFDMAPSRQYKLYSSTDAWYRIIVTGGTAAVAQAAGAHPIKGGTAVLVAAVGSNNRLSIIRDSADGRATLSELITTS